MTKNVIAFSLVALCSFACGAENPPITSSSLDAAKEAATSFVGNKATILREEEVDSAACGQGIVSPGIVSGDFDGDGDIDHAFLVKSMEDPKETTWNGKTLRAAHYVLALAITESGKFSVSILKDIDDFTPTIAVLALRPPGPIQGGDDVGDELNQPGFTLELCEKSATTYFFKDGALKQLSTSD